MKKRNCGIMILCIIVLTAVGCAHVRESAVESVVEFSKSLWGSSTRALENARSEALVKTFQCTVDECFDAVIHLTQTVAPEPVFENDDPDAEKDEDAQEVEEGENLDVFIRKSDKILGLFIENRAKRHIVVMGVPGSGDTTEVGIFFSSVDDPAGPAKGGDVRIEVSSLSKNAKITASQIVFKELGEHYPETAP